MEPNKEKKAYGALIGSVIVVVLLVLGGIYFFISKDKDNAMIDENQIIDTTNQPTNEPLIVPDDLSDLETEIEQSGNADISIDVSTIE